MADKRLYRLGNLQFRIMKVLWACGRVSVAEVQAQLGGQRLAYTTVATMLRKMEQRGLVRHTESQRKFLYEAAVSQEEVARSMTADLVDRVFHGSLADAVSHLLQTREVSREELACLERLIQQRKRQP